MPEATEFDRPLFKRLANNDTGAAAGHQGGIVIPKTMDEYFPQLSGKTSPSNPTVDAQIRAALFDGATALGIVETRYQYQTWGGTRSPERRLTGNLGPLRNLATGGDLLIIEKGLSNPDFFRLTLLRQGTPMFAALSAKVGDRNWGPVNPKDVPVSEKLVEEEADAQLQRELAPFNLFDAAAPVVETRSVRLARSRAFKIRVSALYNRLCAVCGRGLATLDGDSEIEAAHIVPRSLKGSDDARNGLAMCRSHHWAFDRGLITVSHNRRIIIPASVLTEPRNASLGALQNSEVGLPSDDMFLPSLDALAWHRINIAKLA